MNTLFAVPAEVLRRSCTLGADHVEVHGCRRPLALPSGFSPSACVKFLELASSDVLLRYSEGSALFWETLELMLRVGAFQITAKTALDLDWTCTDQVADLLMHTTLVQRARPGGWADALGMMAEYRVPEPCMVFPPPSLDDDGELVRWLHTEVGQTPARQRLYDEISKVCVLLPPTRDCPVLYENGALSAGGLYLSGVDDILDPKRDRRVVKVKMFRDLPNYGGECMWYHEDLVTLMKFRDRMLDVFYPRPFLSW